LNLFTDEEREQTVRHLEEMDLDNKFRIGIKKLLMNVEVASLGNNKVEKFVDTIKAARIIVDEDEYM
jgi:hypothetical protein